jgi:hypothetical protein
MAKNEPIYETFVDGKGRLRAVPEGSFLGKERYMLENDGWFYYQPERAWLPPNH